MKSYDELRSAQDRARRRTSRLTIHHPPEKMRIAIFYYKGSNYILVYLFYNFNNIHQTHLRGMENYKILREA